MTHHPLTSRTRSAPSASRRATSASPRRRCGCPGCARAGALARAVAATSVRRLLPGQLQPVELGVALGRGRPTRRRPPARTRAPGRGRAPRHVDHSTPSRWAGRAAARAGWPAPAGPRAGCRRAGRSPRRCPRRLARAGGAPRGLSPRWAVAAPAAECRRILTVCRRRRQRRRHAVNYRGGQSESILGELLDGRRDRFVSRQVHGDARPQRPERGGQPPKTSPGHWRRACGGCAPTTSTCTGCTSGTGTPDRGDDAGLDDACAPEDPVRGRLDTPPGSSPAPTRSRSGAAGRRSPALQVPYSLLNRDIERDLLPIAAAGGPRPARLSRPRPRFSPRIGAALGAARRVAPRWAGGGDAGNRRGAARWDRR